MRKEPKIFVFGSNLMGIHKKGAALHALKFHRAELGNGLGMQGECYAIPTKRTPHETLPLAWINKYVADFINFASIMPEFTFEVTKIGCGLAGYCPEDIAPMFHFAQEFKNIELPLEFTTLLNPLR